MEEWRDIEGYEGYQVSNEGRVKSLGRVVVYKNGRKHNYEEHILVNVKTQGYLYVGLSKCGKYKRFRVHKLVAEAFLPNPNGYTEINHKDENPLNNNVENLEWCDHSYNINYGTRNKKVGDHFLKKVCKMDLNGQILKIYASLTEASNDNSTSISRISQCCNKKPHCLSGGGFKWSFYE